MMGRIIPVVILLVALGLFLGYVHPTYNGALAEQRAKIRSYDNALAAADTFREKQSEFIAAQEAISPEDRARMEAFLPDGVDNVQLIVDLNALGSRSGMRLSDFVISEEEEETESGRIAEAIGGVTDSIDITVGAVGTYAAFRSFLEGVEYSLRPMDLVALSITDSDTGVYNYNMTFRIYWLR